MTREPELTGSGLRLPTADGRSVTIALAAVPGGIALVIADPCAVNATTGELAPIAVDYLLSITAFEHLRERGALVIDDAKRLAVEAEPDEPRVPRREPELPAVVSAHA